MDTNKMKNTYFAILKSHIFDEMDALVKKTFLINFKDFFFKSKTQYNNNNNHIIIRRIIFLIKLKIIFSLSLQRR